MKKLIATLIALAGVSEAPATGAVTPKQRVFFENKIRPVLVQHCYECHTPDAKKIGGKLLLDSRANLLKGGESGSPIVAGNPGQSLLIQSLHWSGDLEMPPKAPLPPQVIADFEAWIAMGAPDPRTGAATALGGISYEEGDLWALQPIIAPALPAVAARDWPRGPVDRFVLAGLEKRGLEPVADAAPEALVRRLYYDLIGLPPSLREVRSFVADHQARGAAAVGRWVDDLLASPAFGERWGRHWLDVARYAESNGNDGLSRNPTFPHAWRYRDYVINAFNEDTPYDRFLTEQIAGDLLPAESPEQRDRGLIATGFLAMTAKPAKAMNNNFAMDVVADQIDLIGSGIMGLSVACARCHDHKFDPVPTRDYYALAGIFTSSETMWGVAANEKLTAPPTDLHVLTAAPKAAPPKGWKETVLVLESNTGKPKPVPKPKWPAGTPLAMGVRDVKKPANAKINIKGDAKKLGEQVPRGFVSACRSGTDITIDPKQSGRLQLAEWLTAADHPLTSRVMVNRVWQRLFGRGIVATPNDFGVYGDRPSHPELVDHLASRFMTEGWSVKRLIRMIVLSRTYQLASHSTPELAQTDPENIWLARHSRRRLDAEALRDGMLSVSGALNPSFMEGSIIRHRDILVNLAGNLHQPSRHRSVYLCYLRSSPPPELAAFDLPDFVTPVAQRETSVRPGHALFLLNNPFVVEQANRLAGILQETASRKPEERIKLAYQRALTRNPRPEELTGAMELVRATASDTGSESKAWSSLCQALLASSEFRYIE